MKQDVQASPIFVPLMANDCLSALPPLTFSRTQSSTTKANRAAFSIWRSRRCVRWSTSEECSASRRGGRWAAPRRSGFGLARTLLPEHEGDLPAGLGNDARGAVSAGAIGDPATE